MDLKTLLADDGGLPGVVIAAPGRPVVEFWPEDVVCTCREGETFPDGQPAVFCGTDTVLIMLWRQTRRRGGLFWAMYLRDRHVKAVHLPDCCDCRFCHPEWHGRGRCMHRACGGGTPH